MVVIVITSAVFMLIGGSVGRNKAFVLFFLWVVSVVVLSAATRPKRRSRFFASHQLASGHNEACGFALAPTATVLGMDPRFAASVDRARSPMSSIGTAGDRST